MVGNTFDIRTKEKAQKTLTKLTGVHSSIWAQKMGHEHEYECQEHFMADIIRTYGYLPKNYRELDFVYFHVTSSANDCKSFRKHGILDLKKSYMCDDSELKQFLECRDIYIDLEKKILKYHKKEFDITYRPGPKRNHIEKLAWAVGRKFFYDYTTCGFFSICADTPYGGQVHRRPEILEDIGKLLQLNLEQEWIKTHKPYEIVVKISGNQIVYCGSEDDSEEEKVLRYLVKAYITFKEGTSEEPVLMKNGVQIMPSDIIEIKPFSSSWY